MAEKPTLEFKKEHPEAVTPTKFSEESAGFDLYSVDYVKIPPCKREWVDTGISVLLPEGTYGQITSKSSISGEYFADVVAGTLDRDYTGTIKVLVHNHDTTLAFKIYEGDAIAQLIPVRIVHPELEEVKHIRETRRGKRGCGKHQETDPETSSD